MLRSSSSIWAKSVILTAPDLAASQRPTTRLRTPVVQSSSPAHPSASRGYCRERGSTRYSNCTTLSGPPWRALTTRSSRPEFPIPGRRPEGFRLGPGARIEVKAPAVSDDVLPESYGVQPAWSTHSGQSRPHFLSDHLGLGKEEQIIG